MENHNEDDTENNKEKAEKLKSYFDEMSKGKKAPIAKDVVQLKHVETKKQEVSKETIQLAESLKAQGKILEGTDELSNDELTILEAFEKKRLFLERIAIIVNQGRVTMGMEGFKKVELEAILNSLIAKGFLESQVVNEKTVYILTEKGKERIQ